MASLPQIPRRLSVVQTPQTRNMAQLSAADAAAPYTILSKTMAEVGDGLEKVATVAAEQAGTQAVRKDDGGNLVIDRQPIIGPAGAAFNRAARMTYLAKVEPEIETKATETRLAHPNDPDGFKQAWDSFSKQFVDNPDRPLDPLVKPSIDKVLSREGGQNYRTALVQAEKINVDEASRAYKSSLTGLDNKGAALARQGGVGTPEYQEVQQSIRTLYGELATDARFKYPQERIDQEIDAMASRHKGEAVIGSAIGVYDKATPTAAADARRHLQEQAWNPSLNLTPAERQQIVTRGMAALEGRTSENKALVDANKKLVGETIEGLKTTAPYDSRRVNDLLQRSKDLGDVESYYKLSSYQVFHGWRASIQALPIPEGLDAVRAMRQSGTLVDRIESTESRGNANAQAIASSALGSGQFVRATWLDMVKRTRPDLAAGNTDEQILSLRTDRGLSREMIGRYAEQNRAQLETAGVRTDNGALYLAHFLGPGDAIKVLKAEPGQGLRGVVAQASIDANASIFQRNPTAAQLVSWAERKMGTTPGGLDESRLPAAARTWVEAVRQEAVNDVSKNLGARAESMVSTMETAIGKGRAPGDQEVRDIAQLLHDTGRNDLVERVDTKLAGLEASRTVMQMPINARQAFRAQMAAMAAQGGDPKTRRVIDTAEDAVKSVEAGMAKAPYAMGAARELHGPPAPLNYDDPAALSAAVTQRRGFREVIRAHDGPGQISIFNGDEEEKVFSGTLFSNNPKRVAAAASLASSLLADDPDAFHKVAGKKEIEEEAVAFRHYVDDLGMTAEQAAGKLIQGRDPEYQAKIRANVQIKGENIDEVLKRKLSVSDLQGAFDKVPIVPFTDPSIGFTQRQRDEMFRDYAELTKEFYLDKGDLRLSKKLAQSQLKIVWGASSVSGKDVVMRYPPEMAPGMANIPDASQLIAEDAVSAIMAESGAKVTRDKIGLMPIAGKTAAAFKSGQPVPYQLLWNDADGVPRTTNPGRAFVVDPKVIQQKQSERRGVQSIAKRAAFVPEADRTTTAGAP